MVFDTRELLTLFSRFRILRYEDTAAVTTSILMRAKYQTVRYIRTVHNLDLKTVHLRSDASDHAL